MFELRASAARCQDLVSEYTRVPSAAQTWFRAMAQSQDDAAGQAVSMLAHAVGRGEVPQTAALNSIIRSRLTEMRASDERPREITALCGLAMTVGPDEQPGTVILDLLQRGARPEVDDLLSYLDREGVRRSAIGATLLRTAADRGLLKEPCSGSEDAIRRAIEGFASTYADDVMAVCDALGSQGRFFVEPQARDVRRRVSQARGVTPR